MRENKLESMSLSLSEMMLLSGLSDRRIQQLAKAGIFVKADRGRYRVIPSVPNFVRFLHESRRYPSAEKACTRCGVVKPLSQFHNNRRAFDGRQTACITCSAKYARGEKPSIPKHQMEEYGDLSGIVRNIRTGVVFAGIQRMKVLPPDSPIIKEAHSDKTGTVAMGYIETPWGRMPYREVDWPEEKEMTANIATNNHRRHGRE